MRILVMYGNAHVFPDINMEGMDGLERRGIKVECPKVHIVLVRPMCNLCMDGIGEGSRSS